MKLNTNDNVGDNISLNIWNIQCFIHKRNVNENDIVMSFLA